LNRAAGSRLLRRWMMEAILVALGVYLSIRAPNFLTLDNLLAVLRSISMQGLIAFGMTLVIIVGEIDLSVGAMAAFSGCLVAVLAQRGVPVPLAMGMAVASGGLLGAFTGVMRARFTVPSFITTLALLTGLRGAALLITGGFPVTSFPEWYGILGGGEIRGLPFPALVLVAGFAGAQVTMARTRFGRAIYAVGSNPAAARLAGIQVGRVKTAALSLTGALAAFSGIMLSARIMSGTPTVAQGWELDVIAAVIIGGTSLAGGAGTVWGTLVGIVFIGVVGNGMTLLDIPVYTQYVVRGMLIFGAVLLNHAQTRGGG
jgi:ribose/xylose/arabinose/galactoside ABC-type transport system permease subunit